MSFKSFTWPSDPKKLNITLSKNLKTDFLTNDDYYINRENNQSYSNIKIIEGYGDFLGPHRHKYFSQLSKLFVDSSPGKLIISSHDPINALFSEFSITDYSNPNVLSYRFKFIEKFCSHQERQKSNNYYLTKNENLWELAEKFDIPIDNLIKNNPFISNPYAIAPGQKIFIN